MTISISEKATALMMIKVEMRRRAPNWPTPLEAYVDSALEPCREIFKEVVFDRAIIGGLVKDVFKSGRPFTSVEGIVDLILLALGFNVLGDKAPERDLLGALDTYVGCVHGCRYCQSHHSFGLPPGIYYAAGTPRFDILEGLERAARDGIGYGPWTVIGCYSDPYQPAEEKHCVTRKAIEILKRYGLGVWIDTKGKLAYRDLDILTEGDVLHMTLTTTDPARSLEIEPGAALPDERFEIIRQAKERGVTTVVGMSPILYPDELVSMIQQSAPFADKFCLCTLNTHTDGIVVPGWDEVKQDVLSTLKDVGATYKMHPRLLDKDAAVHNWCEEIKG